MKKDHSQLIKNYRFENRKLGLRLVVAINLILSFLFLLFDTQNSHLFYCLSSGLFVLVLSLYYHWQELSLNLLIVLSYTLFAVMEFFIVGLQQHTVSSDYSVEKGLFMDLLIFITPFVYYGLRLLAALPLILLLQSSYQLKSKTRY